MTITTETAAVKWASPKINEVISALIDAHTEFNAVKKSGSNPHFRSTYVKIEDVIQATTPILAKHNLCLTQLVTGGTSNSISLRTILAHSSGQYISDECTFFFKDAGNPQAAAGCITYARRYSQLAILNLGAEDDDGNHAAQVSSSPSQQAYVAPKAPPPIVVSLNTDEYIVGFGKFKGAKVSAIAPNELRSYIQFLERPSTDGKPLSRGAVEFLLHAKKHLATLEKKELEQDFGDEPVFEDGIPF